MPKKRRRSRIVIEEDDSDDDDRASLPAAAGAPAAAAATAGLAPRPLSPAAAAPAAPAPAPPAAPPTAPAPAAPAATPDQAALDLISGVTAAQRASPQLRERLTAIKASFQQRDFAAVFADENLLFYMAAYVPSRALCYLELLARLAPGTLGSRLWCLGAGPGSEAVAVGAWQRSHGGGGALALHSFDVADWAAGQALLLAAMRREWRCVSGGGDDEAGGAAAAGAMRMSWSQGDALGMSEAEWARAEAATLVTSFFVVDELVAADASATLRFLRELRRRAARGANILFVDSAGSFSNVELPPGHGLCGKLSAARHAWVYEVLDQMFLREADGWEAVPLRAVANADSTWFRFDKKLSYDGRKLNNYRVWVRQYRCVC